MPKTNMGWGTDPPVQQDITRIVASQVARDYRYKRHYELLFSARQVEVEAEYMSSVEIYHGMLRQLRDHIITNPTSGWVGSVKYDRLYWEDWDDVRRNNHHNWLILEHNGHTSIHGDWFLQSDPEIVGNPRNTLTLHKFVEYWYPIEAIVKRANADS